MQKTGEAVAVNEPRDLRAPGPLLETDPRAALITIESNDILRLGSSRLLE